MSGTKFRTSAETITSWLAGSTARSSALPRWKSARGFSMLSRALARKISDGSMAVSFFGWP